MQLDSGDGAIVYQRAQVVSQRAGATTIRFTA